MDNQIITPPLLLQFVREVLTYNCIKFVRLANVDGISPLSPELSMKLHDKVNNNA